MAGRSEFRGEAARRVAIGYGFDPIKFPVTTLVIDDDLLWLHLENGKVLAVGAAMFVDRSEHRHRWEERGDDTLGCVDCPESYAG